MKYNAVSQILLSHWYQFTICHYLKPHDVPFCVYFLACLDGKIIANKVKDRLANAVHMYENALNCNIAIIFLQFEICRFHTIINHICKTNQNFNDFDFSWFTCIFQLLRWNLRIIYIRDLFCSILEKPIYSWNTFFKFNQKIGKCDTV